jgi:hypothetical protein
MDHWQELSPHMTVLLEEIDILMPYIDDLVPQLVSDFAEFVFFSSSSSP